MFRHLRLACVLSIISLNCPVTLRAQSGDSARHVVLQAGGPMRRDSVKLAPPEVKKSTRALSADSLSTRSASDSLVEPSWDMDVRAYEGQSRVVHYVDVFTGRAKDRVTHWLERGSRYESMIRSKLKAGGVPEDMYYLALIESGFDTHAYSRAAAVGMWQFMSSTARDMGMRVDWWVDERRDPVKSTTSAVRLIRDLRKQFGSLYLAAAAYNGGPGRVSRGVARYADDLSVAQGEDAFFVLADKDYLTRETKDYVPQLIAAALIAKTPALYSMDIHAQPAFVYDSVMVPPSTPLAAVALASGAPTSDICELNPHLLRGMTAPKASMFVRIPVGARAGFDSVFASLSRNDRTALKRIESVKEDTPEKLARANGIGVASLRAFNPKMQRLKSGRLATGQTLLIPTAAVAQAAQNVPDPSIEKFHRKTKRSAVKKKPSHTSAKKPKHR